MLTASFEAGNKARAAIRRRFNHQEDSTPDPRYPPTIIGDGETDNFFEVEYVCDGKEIEGKLWVGPAPINSARDPDASMNIAPGAKAWNPNRIALRIWKGGQIRLRSLSIAEAGRESAGQFADLGDEALDSGTLISDALVPTGLLTPFVR